MRSVRWRNPLRIFEDSRLPDHSAGMGRQLSVQETAYSALNRLEARATRTPRARAPTIPASRAASGCGGPVQHSSNASPARPSRSFSAQPDRTDNHACANSNRERKSLSFGRQRRDPVSRGPSGSHLRLLVCLPDVEANCENGRIAPDSRNSEHRRYDPEEPVTCFLSVVN